LGRFETKHDDAVLLAVLREVLQAADPKRPKTVTQRAYDAARETAGYGHMPRADRLAARFALPWSELRSRVLELEDPAFRIERSLVSRSQSRRVVTRAECVEAVRQVAARRGTTAMTAAEYEETRLVINAEVARRHYTDAKCCRCRARSSSSSSSRSPTSPPRRG